ncbi:hypothetical protein [Natrarchaeobaculum sulfurireducens]|uniref:Uncharacterized protein n=1 Tax=Natrarchaeobaculum sulfurireducens TaxID=2044521 RepID=A0A346PHH5_9EURY|nr:hypothetical protein [Natrarchaeobaculum sulfurireducens]AXR78970.1 hypothetical protein AArc1_2657 [Natrarchaeobaculum sulfurireducens]
MTASKYATIAEDESGGLHLFRGKESAEFSYAKFTDTDDDATLMERITYERRALIHLPEPMSSEEFKEFVEGRKIADVVGECVGFSGGEQ